MLPFSPFTWSESTLSNLIQRYSKTCHFSQPHLQMLTHTFSKDDRGNQNVLPQFLIILLTNSSVPTALFISFQGKSHQFYPQPHSSLPSLQPSQSPPSLLILSSQSMNILKFLWKQTLLNPSLISVATIQSSIWIFQKGNIHLVSLFSNFTLKLTAI